MAKEIEFWTRGGNNVVSVVSESTAYEILYQWNHGSTRRMQFHEEDGETTGIILGEVEIMTVREARDENEGVAGFMNNMSNLIDETKKGKKS